MPATSSLEREVKLAAPARFRLPDLSGLGPGLAVSAEEVVRHTAVYYDTADLRLTRWDCGLRHRSSDSWTVKLGASGSGPAVVRREFVFPGAPERPPAAALDLLLAVTRGSPVEAVARLRTIRRRVRVRDDSGQQLVEVTNDHVAVLEGRASQRTFRELEVEFAGACPPPLVEEVLARLRLAGSGRIHRVAKHVRALGLEAGVPPEVPIPEIHDDARAGELVRLAIARSVDALVRHDAGVRADEDVEDVHQMRVAVRHLRSHLSTFAPLLERAWARELAEELSALGDALGGVRDADVLGQRLRAALATLPEPEARAAKDLLELLAEQRRRAFAALIERLRSPEHLALVSRLIEAAREPHLVARADAPAAAALAPLVWRRWKRLRRKVKALGRPPTAEGLHAARIAAKHARYAAEAVEPVFGKPARRFVRAMRRLQQTLGEHQDAVVSGTWLREAAAGTSGAAGFSAGLLHEREREAAERALSAWRPAWRRARERDRRAWLQSALSLRSG